MALMLSAVLEALEGQIEAREALLVIEGRVPRGGGAGALEAGTVAAVSRR
jgi:hypothetical protein